MLHCGIFVKEFVWGFLVATCDTMKYHKFRQTWDT
jgi:hypothetical protein